MPTSRPATYADLLALPDHVVGEIIGGELSPTRRKCFSSGRAQREFDADGVERERHR